MQTIFCLQFIVKFNKKNFFQIELQKIIFQLQFPFIFFSGKQM